MVDKEKQTLDANRWRDKYFTLSDEWENQKKSHEHYLNILERALVRVSLAADGQDAALDKHLEHLRKMLRKGQPDRSSIADNLRHIENTLLRLDKQREQEGNLGLESFTQLAEQLSQLKVSRENQKALEHHLKVLKSEGERLNAYPELLRKYASIQNSVLTEHVQTIAAQAQKNNAPQGGLLSRIFGGKPQTSTVASKPRVDKNPPTNKEPSAGKEPSANKEPSADKPSSKVQVPAEDVAIPRGKKADPQSDSASHTSSPTPAGQAASREQTDPDQDTDALQVDLQEMVTLLSELLEQLPLSLSERQQAEQLRDRLAKQISARELNPLINETADLIITVLEKNQVDFEQFLLSLDQQLLEISNFLNGGRHGQDERIKAARQLDDAVRDQVGSISREVESATDISSLKQSVTAHLDSLAASMDDFVQADEQRERQFNEQLQTLQQRLDAMENESRIIKQSLKKETLRAMTDILTGLPNRAALDERLEMEWQRFLRYKHPVAIALLDIDFFKQVNDIHGHLVGDRMLQRIAKHLKQAIRSTDFVARYGCEEFMLIMPETSTEEASVALNKLREEVSRISFSAVDADKSITVSIGLTTLKLGKTLEQQIEAADRALYAAKDNGRNQLAVAQAEE